MEGGYMSDRIDAYRIKLFQDEVARCMHRLFDEGHMNADGLAEVSVIDRESGIVVTSIKPGFIGVREIDDYHGTDMAVVDLDGNLVYDITPPNDNVDLALAIFKARPEVGAIIHSYPIYCGLFANNSRPIPFAFVEQGYITDFDYSTGFSTDVVTTPPSHTQAYFDEVVDKFHGTQFVLLKDFGSISVADNVDNALNYLAWMEEVCQKIVRAEMIGDIQWIDE